MPFLVSPQYSLDNQTLLDLSFSLPVASTGIVTYVVQIANRLNIWFESGWMKRNGGCPLPHRSVIRSALPDHALALWFELIHQFCWHLQRQSFNFNLRWWLKELATHGTISTKIEQIGALGPHIRLPLILISGERALQNLFEIFFIFYDLILQIFNLCTEVFILTRKIFVFQAQYSVLRLQRLILFH